MTELDQAISAAFAREGQQQAANQVYLIWVRTMLFIPVQKNYQGDEDFSPLFATIDGKHFLSGFDTLDRLHSWAGKHKEEMGHVALSGRDLIAGIEPSVYFCLNVGTPHYKEFSPDEIIQLKKLVSKIDQLKNT